MADVNLWSITHLYNLATAYITGFQSQEKKQQENITLALMNRETHSSRTPPEVLPQASSSAHTLPNAPAITIHLLPAYVLNKILEYTLYLPTEHFAGPAFFSDEDWPRFGSCRRTPAVLLVCRTWLVAGEGYLYEAVSVRSAEEAKALNIKLSNNPGLATKVKRLALYPAGPGIRQSPFSLPFRQVLQAVGPTVHTLRLSMHFGAEETVGGLTGGLGYLSPTRLLLSWSSKNRRRDGGLNEKSRVVTEGLHGQIPLWNRLVSICLSRRVCTMGSPSISDVDSGGMC